MSRYPVILNNFVSDDQLDIFAAFLDPLVKPNDRRSHIYGALGWGTSLEASRIGVTTSAVNGHEGTPEQETVDQIGRMLMLVRSAAELEFGLQLDTVNFNYQQMHPGGSNPMHADSMNIDGSTYQSDGTPEELEWSALLYVNTHGADYDGGLINFPEQGLSLAPVKGQLVLFPGDAEFPHEVTEVLSGVRKNFVFFFSRRGNVSGDIQFFTDYGR